MYGIDYRRLTGGGMAKLFMVFCIKMYAVRNLQFLPLCSAKLAVSQMYYQAFGLHVNKEIIIFTAITNFYQSKQYELRKC